MDHPAGRWLLLIHQIPPKPNYLRVKIARRLQRIGAVAIKNTVYALPSGDQTLEDFQWTLREIRHGGGDASVCEASFVDGLTSGEIEDLFREARDPDYTAIADIARRLVDELPKEGLKDAGRRRPYEVEIVRLRRRLDEVRALDFFEAPMGEKARALVESLARRLTEEDPDMQKDKAQHAERESYRARTWVTRAGVKVDRMASTWLISRFIDPEARFKYVPAKGYRPESGELRFDMFDAEFTHEGDRCTFEVLVERFGLDDPALAPIAEIVHDIDLKDAKFGRQEAAGVECLIAGIVGAHAEDAARQVQGSVVFENLYQHFRRENA